LPEVLSQAEIEALLAGLPLAGEQPGHVDHDDASDERQAGPAKKEAVVRDYSFRSPSKFSRDQLRALSMVHEDWGRRLATSLGGQLRTPIHFNIAAVQQMAYHEFMELLTESIIYIFTADAFDGYMLLEINRGLGLCLFERLMGGTGGIRSLQRNLTEIECRVIDGVAERMMSALAEAWESIAPVRPRIEQRETDPQFVQIVEPAETVVAILLEVKIAEETSTVNVCMPAVALDRIAADLSAERWRRQKSKAPTSEMQESLRSRIEKTYAKVSVLLGHAYLSPRELLQMREGDVIPLDVKHSEPLEMRVENLPKFWVRPGRVGRSLAVRVVDTFRDQTGDDD
jgi:flagellar motor switch protein FliM